MRHLHPLISAPLISAGRRALSRRRPDNFTLLLAVLGILGAALVVARQVNYGVGLTPDAVNYISVARSLLAGNGFIQFDGDIYHQWPPLYPLLLAAVSLGIFDPLTAAGPLNAVLFGLAVFAVGIYLRTRLASRLLLLWCGLTLALAWPLLRLAYFAWSEMSFILFIMLALMQAERLLSRGGGGNSALIWAGAFTALACLTRYVGGALAATIICALALQSGVAFPEKARRITIYGLVALSPLLLFELRNSLLRGSTTLDRDYYNSYSVADMLYQIPDTIAEWLFRSPPEGPFELPAAMASALALVMLALLATACFIAVRSNAKSAHAIPLLSGFAAMYAAAIMVAIQLGYTRESEFSSRLIVPAYLPILLACTLALDKVLSYASRRSWRWAGLILAAALCLFLSYQSAVNARVIKLTNAGVGSPRDYNTAMWADSAALDYLRTEITTGTVFSNEVWAAYIQSAESIRHNPLECNKYSIRQRMSEAGAAADAVYLLWLYGASNLCRGQTDYYGGLDQLLAMLPLEPVAAFSDGVLLRYRRTTDAVDADADARRDLRQRYATIAESAPAAASASGFNLYLDDAAAPRWVTYINEQCAPSDTETLFYLHFSPVDSIYLTSAQRRNRSKGYAFAFEQNGIRIGSQCMVSAALPPYAVASIRTGQFIPGESVIWELEYEPGRAERLLAELAVARQARPPIIRAGFEIYHNGGRMIYAKEPCTPDDTAAPFFLHIVPTAAADLPPGREQRGFDDRGFNFYRAGALINGQQCIASAALPDYDIANIHTGQYVPGAGAIWELEYEPDRAERLLAELAAARQAQSPVIKTDFEVYHNAGRLIYAKEPCTPADTTAPFFLHILPENAANLPADFRQNGFENRDFAFEQAGVLSDGQCIASVALPDYDIAIIRTGQYTPGVGRLWETEFAPAAP